MSIYDDLQGVAQTVLAEFSQGVISYVKITRGNGPVDNPGSSSTNSYTIKGVVSGVFMKYVNQNLAVASDLQVTTPVDTRFTPSMKDAIDIDGKRYKIVHIDRKPAAGTPVAYIFVVRAGG